MRRRARFLNYVQCRTFPCVFTICCRLILLDNPLHVFIALFIFFLSHLFCCCCGPKQIQVVWWTRPRRMTTATRGKTEARSRRNAISRCDGKLCSLVSAAAAKRQRRRNLDKCGEKRARYINTWNYLLFICTRFQWKISLIVLSSSVM